MDIKDITGKFEQLEYDYFGLKENSLIGFDYGIQLSVANPMEIYTTVTVRTKENEICCRYRTKSVHTFKGTSGKLSFEQAKFLVRVAVTNTAGTLKNHLYKETGREVYINVPTDEEIDVMTRTDYGSN